MQGAYGVITQNRKQNLFYYTVIIGYDTLAIIQTMVLEVSCRLTHENC